MTPQQIDLVKTTFAKVAPVADTAAQWFYERLFEQNPEYRVLFRGDMGKQGAMLMQTLALAVKHLHEPAPLIAPLQAMGRRHVGYGVKDEDYAKVGAALLWTLEKGLGDAWNDDVRDAWSGAYQLLAGVMTDAAAEKQHQAA
jgi:hemoglobin-like flavoprotein